MKSDLFAARSENEVQFFEEGEVYYSTFLQKIRSAQQVIHLQTYIFEMDKFGSIVKEELIQASLRGVKVYLLVDGIGSKNLDDLIANEFMQAGVFYCKFSQVNFTNWVGIWSRRLHHKILLADGEAFVGGINVISETYTLNEVAPQLDFAVLLKGPIIQSLRVYCELIFSQTYSKSVKFDPMPAFQDRLSAVTTTKISVNDWFIWRSQITKQYKNLVASAEKDIVIINSYFFPRKKFMKQLVKAAKRGVRVRLILAKYSDWPSYVLATQYLYQYFLKNGVEIYQWNKSILHGKLATVDDKTVTIGSFNLNYTSYRHNLEMNVDLFSKEFTKNLNEKIENWITNSCEKIDADVFIEKATFKKRVAQLFFYLVLSLVANFSNALMFRKKKQDKNEDNKSTADTYT